MMSNRRGFLAMTILRWRCSFVQVILDKSQRTEKYSSADFLANQGGPDHDRCGTRHCP